MSSYRTWHREQLNNNDKSTAPPAAVWDITTSGLLLNSQDVSKYNNNKRRGRKGGKQSPGWRIWTVGSDGLVRSYTIIEKSVEEKQSLLDASALTMQCTHILLGKHQQKPPSSSSTDSDTDNAAPPAPPIACLGTTQISCIRNYIGQDTNAGDYIVASLEMAGKVRIWTLPESMDTTIINNATTTTTTTDEEEEESNNNNNNKIEYMKSKIEFLIENATGTIMLVDPLTQNNVEDNIGVWVPLLDGSLQRVATGLVTPKYLDDEKKEPAEAGTPLDHYGTSNTTGSSSGKSIILSMVFHPTLKTTQANRGGHHKPIIAVGRQDGTIDILPTKKRIVQGQIDHNNTLTGSGSSSSSGTAAAIRALSYTPDGSLLIAGNDSGTIRVYDVSEFRHTATIPLVHHVGDAHGLITSIKALKDSARFVSTGTDGKVNVWKFDQMYQPLHTFESSGGGGATTNNNNGEAEQVQTESFIWAMELYNNAATKMIENGSDTTNETKSAIDASSSRLVTATETGWLQIYCIE